MGSPDLIRRELHVPFPTPRLATIALKALRVDRELSPLVRRELSVVDAEGSTVAPDTNILKITYQATTNRMLRVAVNSFMDYLKLIVNVMETLDADMVEGDLSSLRPIPTQ